MKIYAPNESPEIEDVEIGKPIFYKARMEWIDPTGVSERQVWWKNKDRSGRDDVSAFTFNPVIPKPPKLKQKRMITLWLWKLADGEYRAYTYPPSISSVTVVDTFKREVEE